MPDGSDGPPLSEVAGTSISQWREALRSGEKPRKVLEKLGSLKKDPELVNPTHVKDRMDLSGITQLYRGKSNIVYTTNEGGKLFAKSAVDQKRDKRDNLVGLVNEAQMLDRLRNSGVTPQLVDIKAYPNGKKARIVLEGINGKSLDFVQAHGKEDLLKQFPEEVVYATARALDTVHKAGVLVVDVNSGTFLIDGEQTGDIQSKILDLELAIDPKEAKQEELDTAKLAFESQDLGFKIAVDKGFRPEDLPIALSKSELYSWAVVVSEWMLGPSWTWNDNVDADINQKYDYDKSIVLPAVSERALSKAKTEAFREFHSMANRNGTMNLEDLTQSRYQELLQVELKKELMSSLLEHNLKTKNITIGEKATNFLKAALSPNINSRPNSFDGLLKN